MQNMFGLEVLELKTTAQADFSIIHSNAMAPHLMYVRHTKGRRRMVKTPRKKTGKTITKYKETK